MRFAPTKADVEAARAESRARWSHLAALREPTDDAVIAAHVAIQQAAHDLSGTTHDDDRRAILYFALYEDSERNFMFPLVAAHGSLWGVSHTERLDRAITALRPLSRHGRIDRWLEGLDAVRDVNRRVFREIYATFHFTRYFGHHRVAPSRIKPPVLALYNRVHDAIAAGRPLDAAAREAVYYDIFVHEQTDIVDPGLREASAHAGPRLEPLLKRVSPRFAYFPRRERLWFSDFTDVNQRNREGLRALRFAEEVGPERVFQALSEYDGRLF